MTTDRTTVRLCVALCCAVGLLLGAGVSALRWRSDNAVWRERALSAETSVVELKAVRKQADKELSKLAAESTELRERVDELANERAQSHDATALAELERSAWERIAKGYAEVASKWSACVKGHEEWEKVLADRSRYNAADVRRFSKDLEAVCKDAKSADEALRSQLSR